MHPRPALHRVAQIMGTVISLTIADPLDEPLLDRAAEETFAWLRAVDERFSTYRDTSEVNRLAAGTLRIEDASPDLRHVLDECDRLRLATNGYFDAYATGRLDPSGYVKGWSAQVASDRLVALGAANHCLNAGGDIRVRGGAVAGQRWRIGVVHPWEAHRLAWVLDLTDAAIATSGTAERGAHVINPFTGVPARELRSVTVVGADLALADAYATAALAMGPRALDWLAGLPGYECAVLTEDGRAFRSPGLPVAVEDEGRVDV